MAEVDGLDRVIGGRYRLVAELGSDGFGRVWKAHDEVVDVDVAIREVWLPAVSSPGERDERRARAEREARRAGKLRGHPHVVGVFDVVAEDAVLWVVMEFVDGVSLQRRLAARGTLSVDQAARVAVALLRAFESADRVGIVHRDVNPGNVLIAADGRVLLGGFEVVRHREDAVVAASGLVVGSAEYMAPERARQDASVASDLFSLGVVLYEAVEGGSLFRRDSVAATVGAVLSVPAPFPKRAGWLAPLIMRLLEKRPDDRPTVSEALALAAAPSSAGDAPGQGGSGQVGQGQQHVPASTLMLVEVERSVAESAGSHPPPQPSYPQPLYEHALYPQRPASASGIAITAMILCTVSCLFLAVSAVRFLLGIPTSLIDLPPLGVVLTDVVWGAGDIMVLVGTIMMWGRRSVGRMLTITGLSMVLASTLGVELVEFLASLDIFMTPLAYLINVCTVLSIAFVLLPDTRRYMKAEYPSPKESASPADDRSIRP